MSAIPREAGKAAAATDSGEARAAPEGESERRCWPGCDRRCAADAGAGVPELEMAAYHGPLGEAVARIEPQTEASPAGILIQLITMYGNALGRTAYYQVEADKHYANLFSAIVGVTSHGRKGTGFGRGRQVMETLSVDPWANSCITSGLSSGEGLIWAVRDPVTRRNKKGDEEIVDAGVADKRLLVWQGELAIAFKVMGREGNTLSALVRDAWDRGDLRSLTKNSPARATGAHISLIGHITIDELRRHLSDGTELLNGFGNRWLYAMVRRARLLPFGGDLVAFSDLRDRLQNGLEFARIAHRVRMTDAAQDLWRGVYADLTAELPGMLGAATARGAPITLRLALIFAMADARSAYIDVDHLEAALAIWRFCAASSRMIFGDTIGDPIADAILSALKLRHPDGMSRTDISYLFGRNVDAGRLVLALDMLAKLDRAERVMVPSPKGGRPAEMWFWKS